MSSKKITINPELAAFLRSVDEPNVGALADSGEDPAAARAYTVVDLFCGGGGATEGIRQALDCDPVAALDQNPHAIETHSLNHPNTLHSLQDVFDMDPAETLRQLGIEDLDLLWASPDCVHFSRARGSTPREKPRRALAESLIPWARDVRPRFIMVENVAEFLSWGPLTADGVPDKDRAGEYFEAWVGELEALGYTVEWRQLRASDFGEATSRVRLFIIAARPGETIQWPEPTHGPGLEQPYVSAAEVINWSHEARSIFGRPRPLAEKTLARVAKGIERYVLNHDAPHLVPVEDTQHATFIAPRYSTRLASMVLKHFGGMVGNHPGKPFGAITARDSHGLATVRLEAAMSSEELATAREAGAFLAERCGASLDAHGLAHVLVDGIDYVVADIGMRMMQPDELAAAMGFPPSYQWPGTKTEVTARIGNAVPVRVAKALVAANVKRDVILGGRGVIPRPGLGLEAVT